MTIDHVDSVIQPRHFVLYKFDYFYGSMPILGTSLARFMLRDLPAGAVKPLQMVQNMTLHLVIHQPRHPLRIEIH